MVHEQAAIVALELLAALLADGQDRDVLAFGAQPVGAPRRRPWGWWLAAGVVLLAVAVVATEESTYRYDRTLAAEVAAAGGAVLFISHRPDPLPGALTVAVDPVDRLLAPAVAAIPFQLAAWGLAQASGRDPSRFTVGSKVTTRE